MKRPIHAAAVVALTVALAAGAMAAAFPAVAWAADPAPAGAHPSHAGMPELSAHRGHAMSGAAGATAQAVPTMPGQDAFGAIQEIVRLLEADPATDWSKVDLEMLRQHLIDMNRVTLDAEAAATPVDGGIAVEVTGAGRTLAAIRRMIPAHAKEIDGKGGWTVQTSDLANGVRLTVTSADAREVAHIRGLGFIGILARGGHHQPHHLAMAKGGMPHAH